MPRPSLEEIYNSKAGNTANSMPVSNSYGSMDTGTQTSQFTQSSAPISAPSGKPSLSDIYNKYQSAEPQLESAAIPALAQPISSINNTTPEPQGVFSRIGSAIKENVIDPFASRFSNIDYNNQSMSSNLLQSGGALAGGAVDALGKTLMSSYDAVGNVPVVGQVIAPKTSEVITSILDATGQAISSAIPESTKTAISDWATQHPEAAANLGAIVDIASVVPTLKGLSLTKTATGAGLDAVKAETTAKRILQPTKNIEQFGPQGAKYLGAIPEAELNKIRTYSDLEKTLQAQNKLDEKLVTAQLLQDKTKYRLQNFEINKDGLKFNPVKESIKSLQEYGKTVLNTGVLKELNPYIIKLNKGEFTQNDVNELSKLLSRNISGFAQSGTQLKGTNAVKAENLRLALKDVARTGMSPDVAKLDKEISQRIQVSKLAKTLETKVGREVQKAQASSAMRKVIGLGVGIADGLTANILTSTIRAVARASNLPSGVSAIQLEKELVKNLKKLQAINKAKDANQMKQFLQGIGYFGAGQTLNGASDQQTQPQ